MTYKKVSITYHAIKGDSRVDEVAGLVFYDGKPETVVIPEALYDELKNNRCFEIGKPVDLTDQEAQAEKQKEAEKAEKAAEHHKK
jgi:hypothetical protein